MALTFGRFEPGRAAAFLVFLVKSFRPFNICLLPPPAWIPINHVLAGATKPFHIRRVPEFHAQLGDDYLRRRLRIDLLNQAAYGLHPSGRLYSSTRICMLVW
jgi:hypothetical protein